MHQSITVLLLLVLFMARPIQVRDESTIKQTMATICQKGLDLGYFQTPDGRYCCNCPKGMYLDEICKENHKVEPQSRICKPCPFNSDNPDEQTWMDEENNQTSCYQSLDHTYCDQFLNAHREAGSRTENSRCVCNEGSHFANQTATHAEGGCHQHSPCPSGYHPSVLANERHDTQCVVCPFGQFSNYSSIKDKCVPWTECGEKEITIFEGNSTHDRICRIPDKVDLTPVVANSDLSAGAIVGICVGVALLLLIVACVIFCRLHCTRQDSTAYKAANGNSVEDADTSQSPVMCTKSKQGHSSHGEISENAMVGVGDRQVPSDQSETIATEQLLTLFRNCEDLYENARKNGCSDCCFTQHLHDHKIGEMMLQSLNKDTETEHVLLVSRLFGLSEVEEDDVKQENTKQKEIRWQLIKKVIDKEGRKLTPRSILEKDIEINKLRDTMTKVFFDTLRICHQV